MGKIEVSILNEEDVTKLKEMIHLTIEELLSEHQTAVELYAEQCKQHRYDCAYMKMARAFAELSHAERSKVGCIITSPGGQIISQGYNGMPSGMNNCCEHYEDGALVSNKEVLHAESNAITKCAKWGGKTDGATIYVTLSPCIDCAKLIIQSGIKRVVYGEEYRNTEGIELLERAGVQVEQLNE